MFDKSARVYDMIYSHKDYEKEANEIKNYIVNLHPRAKNILDVACGTGKHAQYLSHHYQVDGIDLNEQFIEIAAKRNPNGHFMCKDMKKFQLNQCYDVIMCLFRSIAYVNTYDSLIDALGQLKNHLNPDGVLIVEVWVE